MKQSFEIKLVKLFEQWAGEAIAQIVALPISGSYRQYYRINSKSKNAIGVYNKDKKENLAFIEFTKHFLKNNLPVPRIYDSDLENCIYLLQDLGNTTLFEFVEKNRNENTFNSEITEMYKKVINILPQFQIKAGKELNYNFCYPRACFDKQSMLWDLNYFKYYFLKLAKVHFDEQKLEDDFQLFSDYLLQANNNYFLYRDFQSRNIMILDSEPYFVDYQGGRKGALQYDIASLLYDAKANIPQNIRLELLEHYLYTLQKHISIDNKKFAEHYYGYVLIRIMQALGAYGFRGFYEKKEHFLQSIPYAIHNLEWILNNVSFPVEIATLQDVLQQIVENDFLRNIGNPKTKLIVSINSFSYRRGIPIDETGNGGGFVFDCRYLPNPGKYDEYKQLNGKDEKVIRFLTSEKSFCEFMQYVYGLANDSVKRYKERNFTNLMINFGCTGGQHRSVLCANMLVEHLKEKFDVDIIVRHRELEMKNR